MKSWNKSKKQIPRRNFITHFAAFTTAVFLPSSKEAYASDKDENKEQITKNLIVFQSKNEYKVVSEFHGKSFFKSIHADEAIQFAINLLPDGGKVYLHSGNYLVNKQINLKSFTTLSGSGNSSIIRMRPGHDTGIALKGDNLFKTTIRDLSVIASKNDDSSKVAIQLSSCGDCLVSDVFCVGMQENGVWLNTQTFLSEIRGCKFAGIKGAGVFLDQLGKGRGGEFLPNLITSCIAYRCGIGFLCSRAIVVNMNGCIAHQCKNAFHLKNGSNSVCITGSRSFQIEEEAVIVDGSHEINITGNIFCWSVKEAIKLNNVRWGTLTGNNLIDVGSLNFYSPDMQPKGRLLLMPPPDGLDIPKYNAITLTDVKGVTITANALFNWHVCPKMLHGIFEQDNCSDNLITSNNINWVEKEGIKSLGVNTLVANNITVGDINYHRPHGGEYQLFDVKILDDMIEEML